MTSQITQYIKNPRERAYWDYVRAELKKQLELCYACGQHSIGLAAQGYRLVPVCKKHDKKEYK